MSFFSTRLPDAAINSSKLNPSFFFKNLSFRFLLFPATYWLIQLSIDWSMNHFAPSKVSKNTFPKGVDIFRFPVNSCNRYMSPNPLYDYIRSNLNAILRFIIHKGWTWEPWISFTSGARLKLNMIKSYVAFPFHQESVSLYSFWGIPSCWYKNCDSLLGRTGDHLHPVHQCIESKGDESRPWMTDFHSFKFRRNTREGIIKHRAAHPRIGHSQRNTPSNYNSTSIRRWTQIIEDLTRIVRM